MSDNWQSHANFGLLYLMGNRGFYKYLRVNFVPDITFEEACDLRAQLLRGLSRHGAMAKRVCAPHP